MEHGETPWDGTIREVKEETGLIVEITQLIGVYSKPDRNELVFSFLCNILGGQITLNDEADKIEYFETDKLPTNMPPKQVERIRDTLAKNHISVLKTQTGKSSIELLKEGRL